MINLEEALGITTRKEDIVKRVYHLVHTEGIRYTEAIVDVCKDLGIEPEDFAPYIDSSLKEKIRNQAIENRSIPDTRGNTLFDL